MLTLKSLGKKLSNKSEKAFWIVSLAIYFTVLMLMTEILYKQSRFSYSMETAKGKLKVVQDAYKKLRPPKGSHLLRENSVTSEVSSKEEKKTPLHEMQVAYQVISI